MVAGIRTARLELRAPRMADAASIFSAYASDPGTTRYLIWPRHRLVDDTVAFIEFSESEWLRSRAGPLLIFLRETGELLGSTGLALESDACASTGYLLKADARGYGYATEALTEMVAFARSLGVSPLYALCHPQNCDSMRVLVRCAFKDEGLRPNYSTFPNMGESALQSVRVFARSP